MIISPVSNSGLITDPALTMLFYITCGMTVVYGLGLLMVALGLFRLPRKKTATQPFVSVLVACRNEQDHMQPLLHALVEQTYPRHRYQIIIADDASTDETAGRIVDFINNNPAMTIKRLAVQNRDQVVSPKKNALSQAIAHSSGELLLFTDADCRPGPDWIAGLVQYFTPETGMVIGFSPYELPGLAGFSQRLMAIESLSLAALAAGTTGWGRPATCSGRNLAYRRTVFDEVNGFEHINRFVSGDDDLFLKLVVQKRKYRVRYALHPRTIVPTFVLKSWRSFFQQRLRHASKGFHYGWRMTLVLTAVWLYNFLLLFLFCTPWRGYSIILFSVKALSELPLLIGFAIKMKRWSCFSVWPIAAVLHVVYVTLFGSLGPFIKFNWKGTVAPS